MWDDERIDAAIDETARQLTGGEPDAAFRARVMARIERRRRPTLLPQALAAAIAVAAAIAIAAVVWRHPTHTDAPAREATSASNPVATGQSVSAETVRLENGSTAARRPNPPADTGEGTEFHGVDRLELDPMATAPIDMESIAVAALPADEAIHIEPLEAAAPIAIAPLGPDNEGDRR